MENNRNRQQDSPEGKQNPTIDSPGSKVADYGNPNGGSSDDDPEPENGERGGKRGYENAPDANDDTIGNP